MALCALKRFAFVLLITLAGVGANSYAGPLEYHPRDYARELLIKIKIDEPLRSRMERQLGENSVFIEALHADAKKNAPWILAIENALEMDAAETKQKIQVMKEQGGEFKPYRSKELIKAYSNAYQPTHTSEAESFIHERLRRDIPEALISKKLPPAELANFAGYLKANAPNPHAALDSQLQAKWQSEIWEQTALSLLENPLAFPETASSKLVESVQSSEFQKLLQQKFKTPSARALYFTKNFQARHENPVLREQFKNYLKGFAVSPQNRIEELKVLFEDYEHSWPKKSGEFLTFIEDNLAPYADDLKVHAAALTKATEGLPFKEQLIFDAILAGLEPGDTFPLTKLYDETLSAELMPKVPSSPTTSAQVSIVEAVRPLNFDPRSPHRFDRNLRSLLDHRIRAFVDEGAPLLGPKIFHQLEIHEPKLANKIRAQYIEKDFLVRMMNDRLTPTENAEYVEKKIRWILDQGDSEVLKRLETHFMVSEFSKLKDLEKYSKQFSPHSPIHARVQMMNGSTANGAKVVEWFLDHPVYLPTEFLTSPSLSSYFYKTNVTELFPNPKKIQKHIKTMIELGGEFPAIGQAAEKMLKEYLVAYEVPKQSGIGLIGEHLDAYTKQVRELVDEVGKAEKFKKADLDAVKSKYRKFLDWVELNSGLKSGLQTPADDKAIAEIVDSPWNEQLQKMDELLAGSVSPSGVRCFTDLLKSTLGKLPIYHN